MGVQPPAASWGNMIADGRDLTSVGWWVPVFPGLAIVWTVVACNAVGDALRDRWDPRLGPDAAALSDRAAAVAAGA
jgi:peptide/nickel transport system permease protein